MKLKRVDYALLGLSEAEKERLAQYSLMTDNTSSAYKLKNLIGLEDLMVRVRQHIPQNYKCSHLEIWLNSLVLYCFVKPERLGREELIKEIYKYFDIDYDNSYTNSIVRKFSKHNNEKGKRVLILSKLNDIELNIVLNTIQEEYFFSKSFY